jgi:hypothetical protein
LLLREEVQECLLGGEGQFVVEGNGGGGKKIRDFGPCLTRAFRRGTKNAGDSDRTLCQFGPQFRKLFVATW